MSNADHNPASQPRGDARRAPSLTRNIASNYVALAVNALLMLLLAPYLARCLGQAGYGAWLLALTIVGYSGLLDLGVTKGLARYVANHAGAGRIEPLNTTLGSALLFFAAVGLLSAGLVAMNAKVLADWFELPAELHAQFRIATIILGVNIAVAFPTRVFGAALTARESFVPANAVAVSTQVVATAATAAVLWLGHGLVAIAIVQLGATCASAIANFVVCRRLFPRMHFRPWDFRIPALRELIVYGFFAMLWVLADQLRFKMPPVVVGKCVSMSAVAIFGVAAMLMSQCGNVLSAAQAVMVPRLSMLDGRGDSAAFRDLFLRSSRAAGLVAALVFSLAILLGQPFIHLWFGPDFANSYRVLIILAPAYCLTRTQTMSVPMLYACNRHRFMACALLLEGALNLALAIILAPRWGVYGAAFGVALPMLLTATVVLPWHVCRVAGVRLSDYYRNVLAAPWLVFAAAAVCAGLAVKLGAGSLPAALLATVLWTLACMVILRAHVAGAVKRLVWGLGSRASVEGSA